MLRLVFGGILAGLVALVSWRLHLLKGSGAWAAFGLGLVVFGLGGLSWALILVTFFLTSSGLSRLFKKKKTAAEKFYEKGSTRDAGQVLANGFVAGCFVVFHVFFPDSWVPWTGFVAALAAANADTWATELGILNKKLPILITNGKPVEKGTSGAISLIGTLASLLGSGLVAGIAWFTWPMEVQPFSGWWIPVITIAGLSGSLVDSYIGARAQAIYYCPTCQKETEQSSYHYCGTATTLLRGWRWLDNDWVNLLCTSAAALLASLAILVLLT